MGLLSKPSLLRFHIHYVEREHMHGSVSTVQRTEDHPCFVSTDIGMGCMLPIAVGLKESPTQELDSGSS